MANPRVAWGIDIGNRALKAVKLVRKNEGIVIDDVDIIEHENILSNAGDNRDALILNALTVFTTKHAGLKGAIAAVGVSGQQSFARFIKLPPVEDKKIPEIVRFEAIQQIPFPLDEVEWAYQLFRDEASPDVEVGIFAMRKELVNQHLAFFTGAGLNVQAVQMNPLADYNALAYDDKVKGATMIIDLGAENADLIIAEGETVWMRSIPIGGNHFTETLVRDFKLRFERAEELKRTTATSPHGRRILQAMRPVFADLVSEIQRSIGFYSSTHRDSRISRVLALGGTFKLPGLQKYLQQNLGLEVAKLDTLGQTPPTDGKVAAALSENVLSCVSAYGLALQAMGEAKIKSSLLPQTIQKERIWQQKTKWFAATAACFVLGVGVAFWQAQQLTSDYNSPEARDARDKASAALSQAQLLDNDYKSQAGSGEEERKTIAEVKTLSEYREIWPSLYTEINDALPTPKSVSDRAEGKVNAAAAPTPTPSPTAKPGVLKPAVIPQTNPAAADAAKQKYGDRKTRPEIVLEDMEVKYDFNIGPAIQRMPVAQGQNPLEAPFVMPDQTFNANVGTRDPAALVGIRARHPNMLQQSPSQGFGGGPAGIPMAPDAGRPYTPPPAAPGYATPTPAMPTPTTPGAPGAPGAPASRRGFWITLHLTTPNQGGLSFVNDKFVTKLMKSEAFRQAIALKWKQYEDSVAANQPIDVPTDAKPSFAIVRITVPQFIQLKVDRDRQIQLARRAKEAQDRKLKNLPAQLNVPGENGGNNNIDIRQLTAPPGGVGGTGVGPDLTAPGDPGAVGGVAAAPTDPNLMTPEDLAKFLIDPITGESIQDDYTVTVLIAVELDPYAKPATPEQSSDQPQPAS